MAVYDGVPSIRLEGDEKRALALIPQAKVVLQQAQAVAKRADVPTFSMSYRVSEDEDIYVLVTGGQNIIHISAGVIAVDQVVIEPPVPEFTTMPTLLSGMVLDGIFQERTRTGPNGEVIKYNVVGQWAPTPTAARINELSLGRQASARLAVQPAVGFEELKAPENSPYTFSQYAKLRSSMYSGLMAKVVQVVMGLGRMSKSMSPSKAAYENGVQIKYDYKFNRTHGITKAADGRLWLVEIGIGRGVLAMPLPMFEGSTSEAFRVRADGRNDTALTTVWDELGGLPSGETFPVGAALDRAKVDGRVLQLISPEDLGAFYLNSGYSSSCGWAFSPTGNEAHNVGYHYEDPDAGGDRYQHGDWFQINLTIGAIDSEWSPGKPLAVASANLVRQSTGRLWTPPITKSHMPVKYYEPLLPGLLSHVAKPIGAPPVPLCDTVVYVSFINGGLKTCRYFLSNVNGSYSETESDYEPCMYEGSWSTVERSGNREMPAMPYTNDVDEREIMQESVTTTTIKSNSKGFDPPVYGDFVGAPSYCYVSRSKIYEETVARTEEVGKYKGAVFVVPGFSRECYYYVQGSGYLGHNRGSTTVQYRALTDPNGAYGWRNFVGGNAPPWPDGFGCNNGNCGGKHKERRVMCLVYGEGACSDYADSGPFISMCDNIEAACSAKPPHRVGYTTTWDKGADFVGKVSIYINGQNGPYTGPATLGTYEYWKLQSPDPETNIVQTLFASYSAIGEDTAIYPTLNVSDPYRIVGYFAVPITVDDGHPTFIGVNQS